MNHIYLDWAATSPPDKAIFDEIHELSVKTFGNASSIHIPGKASKKLLEESRERCAETLGVDKKSIIFTSGGTESNNIALFSAIFKKKKGRILAGNIEHPSVSEPLKRLEMLGFEIVKLDCDFSGIITAENLLQKLDNNTILVSVMHINNETGVIQNINKISEIVHKYSASENKNILFHCDGVQAAGKIPIDLNKSYIDFYTISSHKISGPKGAGLLYYKNPFTPIFSGGGQENGLRSGTENIPAIYGFSLALEKAYANINNNFESAKEKCEFLLQRLRNIKNCYINPENRGLTAENNTFFSPYIINFYIKKIPSEVLVRVLSDRGVYISAGSACSSSKKSESGTLVSMKLGKDALLSSVRVSIGPSTTMNELITFCNILEEESKKILNV